MAQLSEEIKREIAAKLGRPLEAIPDEETNPTAWAEMMKELREQQPGLYRAVLTEAHSTDGNEGFRAGVVPKRMWQRVKGLFTIEVEGARAPNKRAYGAIVLAFVAVFVYAVVMSIQAPSPQKNAQERRGVQFELAGGGAKTTPEPKPVDAEKADQPQAATEGTQQEGATVQPPVPQKPEPVAEATTPVPVTPPADELPPLDEPSTAPDFLGASAMYGAPGAQVAVNPRPQGVLYDAEGTAVPGGRAIAQTDNGGGGMVLYEAPEQQGIAVWEASN
ncbi:hypothetical protein [Oceanithermus sp.]|uniref:hypothetical protein n=1 Tax=Oceanithermus sp. TaxID=2268145 RepID=UPI00257DB459|nr:hypothetical protein [Oceanithermus sp.]